MPRVRMMARLSGKTGMIVRTAGAAASSRALGIVLGGGMLANVLGVPIGAFGGQLAG
jgi:predicted MFS family arabinose efflux permease